MSIKTDKTTWDLSPLLASDTDPKIAEYREQILAEATRFAEKWRPRVAEFTDPKVLTEALDEMEAFDRHPATLKEAYYFGLREAVDSESDTVKAASSKSDDFGIKVHTLVQFFMLEVAKIASEDQGVLLESPQLQPYRHLLETAFASAAHTLSEPEEKIMMVKSIPAHQKWVQMVGESLAKQKRSITLEDGTTAEKTLDELMNLASAKSKSVRDEAASLAYGIFADHHEIATAEYNAILGNKKSDDELRHYDRPDAARHLNDDISSAAVDAMLAAVSDRNDIVHRFYEIKAKLLNLSTLETYEINLEYGDAERTFSYEEGVALVGEAFAELDSEFLEIFTYLVEGGNVDVYPKAGKRGGAFCAGYGISNPSYVLLNWTSRLRDVTTLAHEMGHAINNELIKKEQNALNYDTPLSTAEVASTFMEDFVLQRLLADVSDEDRLAILVEQMGDSVATTFRQTALYRFEQAAHTAYRKDGYVPGKEISRLFSEHMAGYMGPAVIQTSGSEHRWVDWSHIRRFFYVYSYSSGQLIAKALQRLVREDPARIKDVKTFLAAGTSRSPQAIFADLGINIEDPAFWASGVAEIEQQLNELEALAKKLGKL